MSNLTIGGLKINIEKTWAYWAVTDENYCGAHDSYCPVGMGDTEKEAIEDYIEKVKYKDCDFCKESIFENDDCRSSNCGNYYWHFGCSL